MIRMFVVAALAGALCGATAQAAVNVELTGVSPGEKLQVSTDGTHFNTTSAGVYNLLVNGVATPSFCIDVAHNSQVGVLHNDYNYVPLDSAPNSPAGPMGASAAHVVEGLWGTYFGGIGGATDPNAEAAALAVAIWKAVNAGLHPVTLDFSTSDSLTVAAVTRADFMLTHLTTFASLQGLIGPGDNEQGFVVPEPTTMLAGALLLLPFGASALKVLRRKQLS